MGFTNALTVVKYLDYSCNKICCQQISKIAQSGHTGSEEGKVHLYYETNGH